MTIDNDRHFCCRCWRRVDAVGSKTLSIHSAPYNLRKFQTKLETTIIWENSDNNFRASSPVRGLQCGGEGLQFNNRPFLLNLDNEDIVLSMTTMMIIMLWTSDLKWSSWEGERYLGELISPEVVGSLKLSPLSLWRSFCDFLSKFEAIIISAYLAQKCTLCPLELFWDVDFQW